MKRLLPILWVFLLLPLSYVHAAPESAEESSNQFFVLTAEMWARPRSGEAVISMLPIRNAVRQLLQTPDGRLLVRYPGGDDGSIWAQELQAWLISLGVGPESIDMRPGSSQSDQIELQVQQNTSTRK